MLKLKTRPEQVFIETQRADILAVISWGQIVQASAFNPQARKEILGY